MKKIRKSLSFATKVMLAFGLLISNLSSLSFVFAAEVKTEISVVDDKLNIKYLDELADDVESVKVNVYENYTYLEETYYVDEVTSLKGKVSSYELTFNEDLSDGSLENEEETEDNVSDVETPSDEISVDENLEVESNEEVVEENDSNEDEVIEVVTTEIIAPNGDDVVNEETDEVEDTTNEENVEKEINLEVESILSTIVFDGTYDVTVEIIDTTDLENPEVIDTQDYTMAVLHDAGLKISVIDEVTGLDVMVLDDLRHAVSSDSPKVLVVAELLAGGLSPRDQILYDNQEYFAYELMGYGFSTEVDFTGKLYGDYKLPVEVELSKFNLETQEYEKIEFTEEELTANVLYGEYQLNTDALNDTVAELELDNSYQFDGNSKNGVVYVLLDDSKIYTMWDLYSVLNNLYGDSELISFVLSNSLYEDILSSYDVENATISLEEHLKGIELDENVLVSISNKGLDITYKLVFAGDLNNDKKLTNDDLVDLINQVVGEDEVDTDKADIYNDDEVNTLDVIVLDQIIKNNSFNVEIIEDLDKVIDAELEVVETDIVSGDKFTVNYIVKLSDLAINGLSGLFTFDKDALELEKVEVVENWIGNSKDGKFLYVGEESLELPEIEESEEEITQPEESEDVLEEENNQDVDALVEEDSNLEESEEEIEVITNDYVVVSATFVAKKAGTHTISVEDIEYFNQNVYYGVSEETVSTTVVVNKSDDNNLASLVVAGVEILLEKGKLEYEITVGSDVTVADVVATLNNVAANITSIVSPEELAEGENVITVTVTAENGDVKVYTIKVIREELPEETTTQVNYSNNYEENDDDSEEDVVTTGPEEDDNEDDDDTDKEEESNLSRIVIIILILLVIAGLIYLIFKDEDEDDTKKINKDVNKLRKEEKVVEVKKEEKVINKSNKKPNNKGNNSNKNKNYKK